MCTEDAPVFADICDQQLSPDSPCVSVFVAAAEGAEESCCGHGGPVPLLSRSLSAGEQDPGA